MSRSNLDEYAGRLKKHLAGYKTDVLGIARTGMWRESSYAHILPPNRKHRNIIEPYRDEFWDYWSAQEKKGKRLHEGFSHLNSSQGFCFNLFFPFLADDQKLIELLPSLFGFMKEGVSSAEFEYHARDGTYVDFSFRTSQRRVFIEVKLSESEFGAASGNERHIKKLSSIYADRASRFVPEFCQPERLFENYQVFRMIWQMRPNTEDSAIFVFPMANKRLRRSETTIKSCALPHIRQGIRIQYLETLLDALQDLDLPPRAESHYRQLREKYLLHD